MRLFEEIVIFCTEKITFEIPSNFIITRRTKEEAENVFSVNDANVVSEMRICTIKSR